MTKMQDFSPKNRGLTRSFVTLHCAEESSLACVIS